MKMFNTRNGRNLSFAVLSTCGTLNTASAVDDENKSHIYNMEEILVVGEKVERLTSQSKNIIILTKKP